MSNKSMIDEYELTLSPPYNESSSNKIYTYGYEAETSVYLNNITSMKKKDEHANSHIQKVKARAKTVKEIKQLKNMSEKLQRSSYKFSPIDNTIDKELTRSCWTREEIALFCLRSMNNNVKKAVKSYKCFTTMMCKFNSKNGNEIDIYNPTILSQLRTGKVVIFDKLDLHGRILVIVNLHHHDPRLQTVDDLILLFVFVLELIMIENPHEYAAERNGLSVLINASKIGFSDFRIEYCIKIIQLLKKNFPIKMGQILIFKPNRLIKLSIKLVLLTKKSVKRRIQIINKVFEPLDSITDFDALSHFIDRNYIPKELGGKHDFDSDNFWELRYQGHMLAELFQKRRASTKIQEPTKMLTNKKIQNDRKDKGKKKTEKMKKRPSMKRTD
ncbi:Sec14d domain containing [Cryptosporidium sp. chipmunk genotype I]|uniref:Sec14d domain containing n=1 Tax=Cryptosporidium sp. chipmunk genotype I TaxID=1280935 RepID=UPI00351A46BE|nr:Sec14d domain containing [Cryptosporidium sp. chipmunk genotype I]